MESASLKLWREELWDMPLSTVEKGNHDDIITWKCFILLALCEGIPYKKASNVGLWCFLCCQPEQTDWLTH